MCDWDDSVRVNADFSQDAAPESCGRSFGKGRGFAPQRSEENTKSWNNGSDYRGRNEDRGSGGGRYGGRFGNDDGDRNSGRRFNDDRRGGREGGQNRYGDDGDDRRGRGGGRRRDDDDHGFRDDKKDSNGCAGEGTKPEPVSYIPEEKTEDQLLEETGIQKGINFDHYEDIPVKVTGVDIPSPINSFQDAHFRDLILNNLRNCKYGKPTPIQKYAIPIIMEGRDVMATAQTGSGKTAAFLLPIINRLLSDNVGPSRGSCVSPQALILSPTRELAIQIFDNARVYTLHSGLKVELIYGGVQTRHQATRLSHGCNILIATPGRLGDFVNRRYISFDAIQFVVLDEADRMLDMGFMPEVRKTMFHDTMTPQDTRQTLMFSATFSRDIQNLANEFLRKDYLFVAVGIVGGACEDVEQNFVCVSREEKKKQLISLLEEQEDVFGTLLFVEQKRLADFLASYLSERGFKTTSIHGDRQQYQREEALRDIKSRKMAILVATNVAARGLDIRGIKHVINFDLPTCIEEYVHRIGRTGRLGNKGKATSFYESSRDAPLANDLVRILRGAKQRVPDFLEQDATGAGDYDSAAFGGYDIRANAEGFKTDGNQPIPVGEEEEW